MRLLDRYLFAEWLKVFLLAVLATLTVLLIERVQNSLGDFIRWGTDLETAALYYALLVPGLLSTVLPLSLLISVLFVLGQWHRNQEITAMRAAGIPLLTITRSLWVGAILITGGLFYLNANVTPQAVENSRLLRETADMAHTATLVDDRQVGLVPLLGFDNPQQHRLWLMNRFSQYTNEGYGVTVYQQTPEGREQMRVMASEAYFDELAGHWFFIDGREFTFDPTTGEPIRSLPFDSRAYPDFQETPTTMLALHKRPEHLSFFELESLLKTVPPDQNPRVNAYAVRYLAIMINPLACLVVVGVAIPFAVSGVRTNPIVGVTRAGILLFAYFVFSSILQLLGEQRIIPIELAAWAPIGIISLISIFLLRRAA